MPTITTGSSSGTARGAGEVSPVTGPVSRVARWAAHASGVGWSNSTVLGTRSPVAARSRVASSTVIAESKPSSLKDRAGFTRSAAAKPRTTAVSARTSRAKSARVHGVPDSVPSGSARSGSASVAWPVTAAGAAGTASRTATSPAGPWSQYRSRWNAYVGRATRLAPVPVNSRGQSTGTPRTYTSARQVRNRSAPPSSRRSVPTATAVTSVVSTISCTAAVSTGWELTSTKARWPWPSSILTAGSKPTVRRRLRYQYPASIPVVSSQSPVTVEKNGTSARRGRMPPSAAVSSSRTRSTWAECEA
ncbi:hypothetical protein GCM10009574_084790 [Streptomyces asiaticus]